MVRSMVGEDIYYPGDPDILRKQLQTAFLETDTLSVNAPVVVAPYGAYSHSAGYITSALKAAGNAPPDIVIVLAPPHSANTGTVLLPESDSFETPFGELPVAMDLLGQLKSSCRYFIDDEIAHLQNHSIEVLLPAIHYHFGTVPIIPLLVPQIGRDQLLPVTDALVAIAGDRTSRVVVSANLSGFTTSTEADAVSRKLLRLLMTAPGGGIVDSLSTFEAPPRSTWPLAVGHVLAGDHTRPQILKRGTFDTEYEGDVGTVVFSSIAYLGSL